MTSDNEDNEDDIIRGRLPKADLKRDLADWRKMVDQLVTVSQKDLDALALPEDVTDAISVVKKLGRDSKERQMGFLMRLVVQSDEDVKARIIARFGHVRKVRKPPKAD